MATPTKRKVEATVAAVRAAAGSTWFDCSDEDTHIELSSRHHGDVGNETPGKADMTEGHRLFKLLRKKFRKASWVLDYSVVDEWVSVTLRKEPITAREKAIAARKARMDALDVRIRSAVTAANEASKTDGCRASFSGFVYNGHNYFMPSIKVVFGKRYLYLGHLGAGFVFADEVVAMAAIQPLVAQFPEFIWERTIREPTPHRTGNYPPPRNIIEEAGYIEYSVRLPN